jgi:hypothetical protein
MRKVSLTVFVGILALLIGSCGSTPEANNSQETQSSANPPEKTTSSTSANAEKNSDVEVIIEPVETERNPAVSGLIASTNPDRRRQSITKGRQDPFGLISVQPVKVPLAQDGSNANNNKDVKKAVVPKVKQPPDPVLAKSVIVTGVMTIGGNTKIIVKAPDEKFSRYVSLGQYLSNGQVLVKSIDMNQNPPVVVLEQFGIEVAKKVGEGAEQLVTENTKASTALLPSSPSESENRERGRDF